MCCGPAPAPACSRTLFRPPAGPCPPGPGAPPATTRPGPWRHSFWARWHGHGGDWHGGDWHGAARCGPAHGLHPVGRRSIRPGPQHDLRARRARPGTVAAGTVAPIAGGGSVRPKEVRIEPEREPVHRPACARGRREEERRGRREETACVLGQTGLDHLSLVPPLQEVNTAAPPTSKHKPPGGLALKASPDTQVGPSCWGGRGPSGGSEAAPSLPAGSGQVVAASSGSSRVSSAGVATAQSARAKSQPNHRGGSAAAGCWVGFRSAGSRRPWQPMELLVDTSGRVWGCVWGCGCVCVGRRSPGPRPPRAHRSRRVRRALPVRPSGPAGRRLQPRRPQPAAGPAPPPRPPARHRGGGGGRLRELTRVRWCVIGASADSLKGGGGCRVGDRLSRGGPSRRIASYRRRRPELQPVQPLRTKGGHTVVDCLERSKPC